MGRIYSAFCHTTYLLLLLFSVQLVTATASAQSPPKMPLPTCTFVDGTETGACPQVDFLVSGSASGDFTPGGTIQLSTYPDPPICFAHYGYLGYWEPVPCFAGVSAPTVNSCGYIDLTDGGKFKETSCKSALYMSDQDIPATLFTVAGINGNPCGGRGNFQTYIYGGPSNVDGAEWHEFGPARQHCQITFNGPRPDGLYGPTWVKITVGADIAVAGDGRSASQHPRTELYVPIDGDVRPYVNANFDTDVIGLQASFINKTQSNEAPQNLTYTWDFGDGNSSSAYSPKHLYSEPGVYNVTFTAINSNGDEDQTSQSVETVDGLIIQVTGKQSVENGSEERYQVRVGNFESGAIDNFTIAANDSESLFQQKGVPQPAVISTIAQYAVFTSHFSMAAIESGETVLQFTGTGTLASGESASAMGMLDVAVQPSLSLDLAAPFVEVSGEEVTITLTVTNDEQIDVNNIRVDSLLTLPNELVEFVSGPIDENGNNPTTAGFTLAPGEAMKVSWRYNTKGKGVVDLQASIAFDSITQTGRALKSVDGRFAIEVAALELKDVRLQPGKPIPGEFAFIRGTIANIGNFDIQNIDFALTDDAQSEPTPEFKPIDSLLDNLSELVTPRIELLAAGQEKDFIIPVGMILDIGSANRYTLPVTFTGKVVNEQLEDDVEVSVEEILRDDIDRTDWWVDIKDAYYALMVRGIMTVVNELDEWADDSLIGGITVGTADGVITALEKMGQGTLDVVDFLGETSGDGGETLNKQARQIVTLMSEYYHGTTVEQMMIDLADIEQTIAINGVDVFADWMFNVETAAREGRARDVAALLAEPSTQIATGIGAEQAGAQVFAKLLKTGVGRKVMLKLTKKINVPNESSGAAIVAKYIDELEQTFDDLPEGVPLTGKHALAAGVEGDDLAFMLDEAKRSNTTFFVRPRPATAAAHARAGYNAKPLPVKMKSVSELDCKWLGYNCADRGLVVLREPDEPWEKLRQAIADGEFWSPDEFVPGDPEIQDILKRYSAKKAEFENLQDTLAEMNAVKTHRVIRNPDPANPDLELVEEVQQAGILVKRYGRDVITTVSVEPGSGRLIFDFNGKPVYSDIDLLSVAKRDGSNTAPTLHENILKNATYAVDGQHHATAQTSDFPKAEYAQKMAMQYLSEHKRGGEGLLIIGPEGITKGYVESFDVISLAEARALDAGEIKLSGYDLYGLVVKKVTYTGVQTR